MVNDEALDSYEGFVFLDSRIDEEAKSWGNAKTRYAIYVYTVLARELYRHAKDEFGNRKYPTRRSYLKDLSQRLNVSVSNSYRYIKTLKLVQQTTGFGIEEIIDRGITSLAKVTDYVATDGYGNITGLIREPSMGREEAIDRIGEAFKAQTQTDNPTYADMHALLAPSHPTIQSYVDEKGVARWTYEFYEEAEARMHFFGGVIDLLYTGDNGFVVKFAGDEDMPAEHRKILAEYFYKKIIGGKPS